MLNTAISGSEELISGEEPGAVGSDWGRGEPGTGKGAGDLGIGEGARELGTGKGAGELGTGRAAGEVGIGAGAGTLTSGRSAVVARTSAVGGCSNAEAKLGPGFIAFCTMVIVAGSVLHFTGVDKKDCWFDEAASLGFSSVNGLPWKGPACCVITAAEAREFLQDLGNSPLRPLENIKNIFPDQGAGFPLVAWVVAKCFGNTIEVLRALTGVFAVLASPLLYWLVIESTRDATPGGDKRAALIAATFGAVSPVINVYGAEARPYAMLIVLVLASSISLLRAQRLNRFVDWFAYSLFTSYAVITHVTVAALIPVHCVFLMHKRVKLQTITLVLLPTCLMLGAWWAFLGQERIDYAFSLHRRFVDTTVPLDHFFRRFFNIDSLSFFDMITLTDVVRGNWWTAAVRCVPVYVSLLNFVCLGFVLLRRRSSTLNVVALSLIAPTLCFIAADFALAGHRALVIRYAIFLCVSSIFTTSITLGYLWNKSVAKHSGWFAWRTVCASLMVVLVCLSLVSQVAFASATFVWTKKFKQREIVAARQWLNQHKKPLLLIGSETFGIAMLPRLRDDVNCEFIPSDNQYLNRKPLIVPPGTDAIVAVCVGKIFEAELKRKYPQANWRIIN